MSRQIDKIAISKNYYKINNHPDIAFHVDEPDHELNINDILTKILIFEDRYNEWFFEVGNRLKPDNEAGFVILMIVASCIEGLAQYGHGENSRGNSKERFIEQFRTIFSFPEDISEIMYDSMRCGLFHDSMIRKGIMISTNFGIVTPTSEDGTYIINPHLFLEDLQYYFEQYIKTLQDPANSDKREKFEKIWDEFNSIESGGQKPSDSTKEKKNG